MLELKNMKTIESNVSTMTLTTTSSWMVLCRIKKILLQSKLHFQKAFSKDQKINFHSTQDNTFHWRNFRFLQDFNILSTKNVILKRFRQVQIMIFLPFLSLSSKGSTQSGIIKMYLLTNYMHLEWFYFIHYVF